jgi:hypothetical protein
MDRQTGPNGAGGRPPGRIEETNLVARGRPRGGLGAAVAGRFRSRATAERTATVISREMWKVQSRCGTSPEAVAIGTGALPRFQGEPRRPGGLLPL